MGEYLAGPLRPLMDVTVENPNRERLGKETKTPFVSAVYDTYNQFAITGKYNEALESAQEVRRKVNAGDTLTPEDRKQLIWLESWEKEESRLRAEKSKITRQLNKGVVSGDTAQRGYDRIQKARDTHQREALYQWRSRIVDLPSTRTNGMTP